MKPSTLYSHFSLLSCGNTNTHPQAKPFEPHINNPIKLAPPQDQPAGEMQDSSRTQSIITDQLPQRSKDDHPLTYTGGKHDIAEDEAGYLQILAPIQPRHTQEREGSNDVSTDEEQADNIYDNDGCFPPEFHAKMRQHAQEKNKNGPRSINSIQEYLLESLSQRYIPSASSSDEEEEQPAEQMKAGQQRKLSTLINALDLRPERESLMRDRSSGISRQQVKSAKRIKRKKKSSSLMIHPVAEMHQPQTGTTWYRPLPTQEELLSSSSPPSQLPLTQKQKLESFEKLLEAHGIPKQEQQQPLLKTDAQRRRDSFRRSESMPLKVLPLPQPLPEAPLASKRDKEDVIPGTASDRAAALPPLLEPEHC